MNEVKYIPITVFKKEPTAVKIIFKINNISLKKINAEKNISVNKLEVVARLLCLGCKHNSLSQREHSCIMLHRKSEQGLYFCDIVGIQDEGHERHSVMYLLR